MPLCNAPMSAFRAMIRDHRTLALFVVMLALCVKFVVPQGYMIGGSGYRMLTVQVCFDGLEHRTTTLAIPMEGKEQPSDADGPGGKADGKCAFASLNMGALGGADMALLAIALAFVLALGFAPVSAVLHRAPTYLRPPLRGPPALS